MKLFELAQKLNITSYPDRLNAIYESLSPDSGILYNEERILALNEKYSIFGEYIDEVIRGARALKDDPDLLLYARAMLDYQKSLGTAEARELPALKSDGSIAYDMMPLLVLFSEAEEMIERYERRGFSFEQIKRHLAAFRINIWVSTLLSGRASFDMGRYKWVIYYVKAEIFDHGAFNFQPLEWRYDSVLLKNKKTDEHVFCMCSGTFHKSGQVLGSAGCKDADGAFDAVFEETPEYVYANPVYLGVTQKEPKKFDKSEWEVALRKGDVCVNVHIPRKTDLTERYVEESLREGLEIAKRAYPEMDCKYLACASWMLDIKLPELLGEDSKLSSFNRRFTKIPILSGGGSCMPFVFPGYQNDPPEDLPETTSLQRKIKELMKRGEDRLGGAGVVADIK